jgi:hypothetical protein
VRLEGVSATPDVSAGPAGVNDVDLDPWNAADGLPGTVE